MKLIQFRYLGASLLGASVMWALVGCDKVPMPTSDGTPPTVSWIVRQNGGSNQNLPATSTIAASKTDTVSVTLVAEDPQGIKKITLGGGGSYTCTSGGLGQNKSYLGATDTQTLGPDSDGKVLVKIILIQNFDAAGMSCGAGFSFGGGSHVFNGTGENYFAGTATGKLTINVAP